VLLGFQSFRHYVEERLGLPARAVEQRAALEEQHHVLFRSHGGHRTAPWNQTALCEFHHHRCIHAGYLRVCGRAPDRLVWTLRGRAFTGGVE
jgi:hypothetical protein